MRLSALMFSACAALYLFQVAVRPLSADTGAEAVIQGVERRYNGARTLSVDFTESFSMAGHPRHPESGTLVLKKPGRMRWTYSQPAGKLFVSNGKQVYLYSAADNRVERSTMKTTEDLRAPMAFLLGRLDLRREFGTVQIKPENHLAYLTAEARNGRLPYTRVQMTIRPDYSIGELSVEGRDSSLLGFVFSNEVLNRPVPDREFDFLPPPGAEIVDAITAGGEN
jgi:outer membrane lipoprotein carrier protein